MAIKTNKSEEIIEIKPIEMVTTVVRIVGDTPLIVHAWSEKAKRLMLENQMKTTKTKAKVARDPYDDFIKSLYWLEGCPSESHPKHLKKLLRTVQSGASLLERSSKQETQVLIVWVGLKTKWV